MVTVEHENVEELKKLGMGIWKLQENCFRCKVPTRYWYTPKNTPCCQNCANWTTEKDFEQQ